MEQLEIYLSKLASHDELYAETAKKLGAEHISDGDELRGILNSVSDDIKFLIYESNEDMINDSVRDIIGIFSEAEKNNSHISMEVIEDEFLNIIDETAHITSQSKPRCLVHRDGDLHAAVHVWIIRRRDMGVYVLLQKRSHLKDISPDCYDVSAAGHVSQNGEFRSTAVRETAEEIGLEIPREKLELIGLMESHYSSGKTHDNEVRAVYLYRGDVDEDSLVLQESEVAEVGWAELDELLTVIKNEEFKHCLDLDELAMIKKAVF